MASTYLQLVNKLRNRFNEPNLTSATWGTVVGFDQYTKEAINYAYHDILNAEMEWPFLHRTGSFLTVPGVQFYDVSTADEYAIKEVDWDSFYILLNTVSNTYTAEAHTIPSSSTYTVTPTNTTWVQDLGVKYASSGIDFESVDHDPQESGEYTIRDGVYYFSSADASVDIELSYTTATASTINNQPVVYLPYIQYDFWRQVRLTADFNAPAANGFGQSRNVFKTQVQGEIGITPVPNQIYNVNFEYWIDADDMVNAEDTTLLPVRYEQVLLHGASKYCYEFREDTPLAKNADDKFNQGVARMRIELINRNLDMRSGFRWRQTPWFTTFIN